MQNPLKRAQRRPGSSGCRGYSICFSTVRGTVLRKAMGTYRPRLTLAQSARPPGIFASARRKETRFVCPVSVKLGEQSVFLN